MSPDEQPDAETPTTDGWSPPCPVCGRTDGHPAHDDPLPQDGTPTGWPWESA